MIEQVKIQRRLKEIQTERKLAERRRLLAKSGSCNPTEWEKKFMQSIQREKWLTKKQWKILYQICDEDYRDVAVPTYEEVRDTLEQKTVCNYTDSCDMDFEKTLEGIGNST